MENSLFYVNACPDLNSNSITGDCMMPHHTSNGEKDIDRKTQPYDNTLPTRTSPSTFFEDRETRLQEEETFEEYCTIANKMSSPNE